MAGGAGWDKYLGRMAHQHGNPDGVFPPPPRMYSHVVKAGGAVYVSGQLPFDAAGGVVGEGDAAAQYRQVWANVCAALRWAGASEADVVKTTTYVVGAENIPAVRAVRQEVNPQPPPASTLVAVSALANPACLVEVEAVAVIEAERER